jgi:hypothetical protein
MQELENGKENDNRFDRPVEKLRRMVWTASERKNLLIFEQFTRRINRF